tara:strand:- start:3576 stop:4553 length:978 start_codon:yes stop_codon:yes gene_type:complete
MGTHKTLAMLQDLKKRVNDSQSDEIELQPVEQPVKEELRPPYPYFDDFSLVAEEQKKRKTRDKVVLPWLLQSSWLPSQGAPDTHVRSFGNLSIVSQGAMLPTGQNIGLPSGLIARRILLALTTIARRKKSKTIEVPSISWLLNWTQLKNSGRQHKQIQRNLFRMALMSTNIFIAPRDKDEPYEVHSGRVFDSLSVQVVDTEQETFSFIPKHVSFTDRFYERVIEKHPVAYDAETIFSAPSPFVHDIMLWLVHRQTDEKLRHRKDGLFLTYENLLPQFGRKDENIRKFRARMRKALNYIKANYETGVELGRGGVIIPFRPRHLGYW